MVFINAVTIYMAITKAAMIKKTVTKKGLAKMEKKEVGSPSFQRSNGNNRGQIMKKYYCCSLVSLIVGCDKLPYGGKLGNSAVVCR